jgi:lysophospholipase L1-like esterase
MNVRFLSLSPLRLMIPLVLCGAEALAAQSQRPEWHFRFAPGGERGSGAVVVGADTAYSDERGYGFELSPSAASPVSVIVTPGGAATAKGPFFLSAAVPEGNYRVTVTLGDRNESGITTVKAETRRLMLERVRTAPGDSRRLTFIVNVRTPTLRDGTEVKLDSREMNLETHEAIARHWDRRLTLEFSDAHPVVSAIDIEPAKDLPTVFITGDSTVTDQPNWPGASWGQMVTRWFKPDIAIANHAESGETLKGFLKERRWDKLLETVRPGDFVLIEFGTNDSKSSGPQNIYPGQDFSETYAPAETIYRELLRRFVADVKARKASPIILSPSARREETTEPTSLAPWAKAAMEVAKELGIPGIDLNAMGVQLNRALGAAAGAQFADRTHHVEYGACLQAKCVVLGLRRGVPALAAHIVDDFRFDPDHPEPLPDHYDLPPDPKPGRRTEAK